MNSDFPPSPEARPRPGLLALAVVLLASLVLVVVLVMHRRELREEPPARAPLHSQAPGSPVGMRERPDAPKVVAVNVEEEAEPRSPLADRLNAPDGTLHEDLRIVAALLENHDSALGSVPVGNNAEITASLSGRNALRHAPLPAEHAAISAEGELIDRWGRAFIFHPVSRHNIEVRSRGPDGEAYTADDAVMATGPRPSWLEEPGKRPAEADSPSP